MGSEAYRDHTTTLQETRKPSHLEFGALLIQEGHAPASVTRICQALGRLGVAHSEDLQERDTALPLPGGRLPAGACPACRGRHRRHTDDHRCRRATNIETQTPTPSTRGALQPRRYGAPRRPQMTDAGPYFQPCPVAARSPEATTTNARLAMQQLASRSTPYPAAQTSTQVSSRPRATGAGPPATDTTSSAPPPTTVRDHEPAANTGEANEPPLPTTVDQLRAALAASHRPTAWGKAPLPRPTQGGTAHWLQTPRQCSFHPPGHWRYQHTPHAISPI